jgi:hypothetical protein
MSILLSVVGNGGYGELEVPVWRRSLAGVSGGVDRTDVSDTTDSDSQRSATLSGVVERVGFAERVGATTVSAMALWRAEGVGMLVLLIALR